MALVTNRCSKHGHAHPEIECPSCEAEAYAIAVASSRSFFKNYGDYQVQLKFFEMKDSISVEELYQHFRMRLLEEKDQGR